MTSQQNQTQTCERQTAPPREILRVLPTARDYNWAVQTRANLRQEMLFFFCSITTSSQELYCYFNAIAPYRVKFTTSETLRITPPLVAPDAGFPV